MNDKLKKIADLFFRMEKHYLNEAVNTHNRLLEQDQKAYSRMCQDVNIQSSNLNILFEDNEEKLSMVKKALGYMHGHSTGLRLAGIKHHESEIETAKDFLEEIKELQKGDENED